ncbi:unnamed protein product [Vitrella brassicaformis CCMP3155]|uniref:CCR4-NOT transcription complex subunit 10 n=2 Tax=Vitrella brassicaformis TaxID=1169539 RepID=A0A0G4EYA0_VITBC|nr:unnamed protein product [Vitrella brassicaformis CCMP3155]|eukprot:CEM04325.1 unnamed protein product [Vitrella brassicaformis CCMP3155]
MASASVHSSKRSPSTAGSDSPKSTAAHPVDEDPLYKDASGAFDLYYSGKHAECESLLRRIQQAQGTAAELVYRLKVSHNLELNKYLQGGCCDPDGLLRTLTQLHEQGRVAKRHRDEAAAADHDDVGAEQVDEDLSVLAYNRAVLSYQLRNYEQARSILEDLFKRIEPVDDFLAVKICLLLMELYLTIREPERAADVLAYFEKPQAFPTLWKTPENKDANGLPPSTSPDQPAPDAHADAAPEHAQAAKDDQQQQQSQQQQQQQQQQQPSQQQGEESAEGQQGAERQLLPALVLGSYLPYHGRSPETISASEFKFFTQLYRAKIAVMQRNLKGAKKELKTVLETFQHQLRSAPILTASPHTIATDASQPSSGGSPGPSEKSGLQRFTRWIGLGGGSAGKDTSSLPASGSNLGETALQNAVLNQHNSMALMLKANLEYFRLNFRKSTKLLTCCQFNFAAASSTPLNYKYTYDDIDDEGHPHSHPHQQPHEPRGRGDHGGVSHQQPDLSSDFHPAMDPACATVFYNNLGCIHFLMRKPHLACFYFNKAMQANVRARNELPAMLHTGVGKPLPGVVASRYVLDRGSEVSLNAGLQLLLTGSPLEALIALQAASEIFPNNAKVWLRMGECCVALYLQWARKQRDPAIAPMPSLCGTRAVSFLQPAENDDQQLATDVIRSPVFYRRLLLSVQKYPAAPSMLAGTLAKRAADSPSPTTEDSSADTDAATEEASGRQLAQILANDGSKALRYAETCFRTALLLVQPHKDKHATGESAWLEDACDVKLAYVCLGRRDWRGALWWASKLLARNGVPVRCAGASLRPEDSAPPTIASSVACLYLCRLYAAEALCHLNNVAEAVNVLKPLQDGGLQAAVRGQSAQWEASSAQEGKEKPLGLSLGGSAPADDTLEMTAPAHAKSLLVASFPPATSCMSLKEAQATLNTDLCHLACRQFEHPPEHTKTDKDRHTRRFASQNELMAGHNAQLVEAAKGLIRDAVSAYPTAAAPLRTLVYLLLIQGKREEALQLLQKRRADEAFLSAVLGPARPMHP